MNEIEKLARAEGRCCEMVDAEDAVEAEVVDEAVCRIRKILVDTVQRGAVEIGEYVFERFFAGDPGIVRSKNPRKKASFRLLAARCGTPDLPISCTWLNSAVATAIMRRSLPHGSVFARLPFSHQAVLLALREPAKIEEMARGVVDQGLSVRELRNVVRQKITTPSSPRPEGDVEPAIVLNLQEMLRRMTLAQKASSMADLEKLSATDARYAVDAARRLLLALNELLEKLESFDCAGN
jgi:hypothetical protein